MAFFLTSGNKKGALVLLGMTLVLIGFIGFLVVANYQSQHRVQEFALGQLRQDTTERANALSYYCYERKDDIENLAASRSLLTFFENKALGMSMEYGLRASLLGISETFERLLRKRKIEEDRIYTRIVFIESDGKLLVDTRAGSKGKEQERDWKGLLRPESPGATISVEHKSPRKVMVSIPYFFKDKYTGQIVAWISPRTIYHFATPAKGLSRRFVYIACKKDHTLVPRDTPLKDSLSSLPEFGGMKAGEIHRFKTLEKDGSKVEMIALRVPVKGAPLSVVAVLPASELEESMALWYLPLGMGILAILILCGTAVAYRINTQRLMLNTRLDEASRGRQKIEKKNRELSSEISERRQAVEAARREASINEALAEVSNVIISSPPIEDLSFAVLQQARRLTGSRFGYAGYIDLETGYLVCPTLTRDIWDACEVQDKDIVFKEFRGLWGWVLENKESLCTNMPKEDHRFSGTPQGHIPIERFLSVPALFEEKLVGQISLANPEKDYTEQDVALAGRLATLYAIGIRRKRDEEALEGLALDLEQRIERRTAELTRAVTQLSREIEDRKEAEEKLKASEKRTRSLIEASPVGIFINRGGKYVYINPAFLKMFGYEHPDEVMGGPVESLIAPQDRELLKRWQRERLEGKKVPLSYEIRGQKKDGKGFDVVLWGTVIDYEDASVILGFVVDMSFEKELRSQLLQSQKMEALGTLAGGIAHDFNNILTAIIGYAELAKMKASEESGLMPNLDEVLKAGNRAKNLVGQILTVSRQTEEERRPMAPIYVVNEALKLLRASVPSFIKFDQRIEKDTGTILADPTRIHQILMNLCTNAQHAMCEGEGTLGVGLCNVEVDSRTVEYLGVDPGAYVRLTVSDTGHGIPPEIRERIFEPYFTTKEKGEGTGLGLSVVHGIMESYGGKISVYSEPGKGSTFHVYFSRIDAASKTVIESEEPAVLFPGTERILFLDDEETLANMGKQMLERLGYEVTALTDSVEAIKRFSKDPDKFDLVITDLSMPDMTGERLAQEVMNMRPGIPIIMCSGFGERIWREKAKKMGARAFIRKPFTFQGLAKAVREALDS